MRWKYEVQTQQNEIMKIEKCAVYNKLEKLALHLFNITD